MSKQSGKIVLVLVLILLIIGASAYFLLPDFKRQQNISVDRQSTSEFSNNIQDVRDPLGSSQDYFSKDFKMTLKTLSSFQIEDNFPIFTLKEGTKKIDIIRNGTNFDNLSDYLENFDKKRSVKEMNREELVINAYPSVKREILYSDSITKQKSIYLYVDHFVYIFSTSDESLYPVLDQIVQSFEYKGTLSSGGDKP